MSTEESIRTDNYKIVVKPCQCDEGDPDPRYFLENGELFCAKCKTKIDIVEFILYGCVKCGVEHFREIDKLEKNFFKKNKISE